MEATQTVGHKPYVVGAQDDYGNDVDSWEDPTPRLVYGWAPAGTFELTDRQQQVTHDVDLYAPASFMADPRDRFVIEGRTYVVVGEVMDFTHGPFGFEPGVVVNLERVTG